MTVSAKMILDSRVNGIRGCSIQMRYPKFIHGELMTHRVFSRNASSSRAIPVERLIQDVLDDTAMPEKWFKNKPGMQGTEEITGWEREHLIAEWLAARDSAIAAARNMIRLNAHKQHINRVIEPFCHINTLVTATQWSNFLALRDHKDADPTIYALARETRKALDDSTPGELAPGKWHLPYIGVGDRFAFDSCDSERDLLKISVARCARVSYLTQEGTSPLPEKDLELYDRLIGGVPLHASPAEHQFKGDTFAEVQRYVFAAAGGTFKDWHKPHLGGNLGPGLIQYRKTLPGECQ